MLPFMVPDAIAQETDEHVRTKYIFCKLNTGFTFDDEIAHMKEYGKKLPQTAVRIINS